MRKFSTRVAALLVSPLVACSGRLVSPVDSELNVDVKHSPKAFMDPELEKSSQSLHHYLLGQLSMKDEDLKGAIENFSLATELSPKPAPELHARRAELELRSGNLPKALEESSKAIAEAPSDAAIQLLHAGILEASGRDDEAEALYLKVIEASPKRVDPYILLAGLYTNNQQHDRSIALLRRLLALVPGEPVANYYLGRSFELSGDLPQAEKFMRAAYGRQPDNQGIAVELMRVLLKQEKVSEAKTLSQNVIEKDPENVVARKVLGQLLLGESRYEEALQHLQVLEKVESDSTETRYKIALIEIERRNFDEAIRELNLVLAKKPDFSQARYYLASVLATTGKVREAADELFRIEPGSEEYEKSRTFAAFLLKQAGDFDGAERAIRDALEISKNKRPLVAYLVSVLREANKHQEAREILESALDEEPDNDKFLYSYAIVLHDLNEEERAMETMERVLVVNPKNSDALNYVAYGVAESGGDLSRALKLAQEALAIKPNDGYYVDTMGWIYFQMGAYREAVEMLGRAVSLVNDDVVVVEHFADALLKNGERDKALEQYETALGLKNDKSSDREEVLARIRNKIEELRSNGTTQGRR